MRGKKIELTPSHIEKLTQAVLVGATYELAARYAGISKDTFDRWRQKAEKAAPGTPLAQLRERLAEAEGRTAVHWLALINKATQTDWKAASWLLSHRYPEQYGGGVLKVAPTGEGGEARGGEGLTLLLQQATVYLPSKSPSPEQWQKDVEALRYPTNGALPEPRP
jgi:hypothetical protein